MDKRDLVETWFRRVWLEEDLTAIDDMMTDIAPVHGLNKSPHLGAAEFKGFVTALLVHIKETNISIDEYMECGDQVSLLMNVSAKCRKTGKPVQMFGLAMCRITDDKITQAYNYADFIGLFEQLDIMPTNAMHRCLCGEALKTAEKN